MRNKKVIALTVLFMFLLSSVCMAYQPDPHRWVWIYSDDQVGVFYDSKTVEFFNYDSCDVWVMFVLPNQKMYQITHIIFRNNGTGAILATVDYNEETGEIIDTKTFPLEYAVIIPGSIAEVVYNRLFPER